MLKMEDNIRPPFSQAEARAILKQHYGIQPLSMQNLPSELDRNYRLSAESGGQYVLKIAHSSVSAGVLDLQNKTLKHLRAALDTVPDIIPAENGELAVEVAAADGTGYRARLLRYIDAVPLCDFRPHSEALLADIGTQLGALSARMQSFRHREKRPRYRWNIHNLMAVAAYGADLPADKRSLLDYFLELYEDEALPTLPRLRQSHIFNDPNDSNILICADGAGAPRVAGLIDFGDMTYSATVVDLAVALAYIMMGSERPLDKAAPVVRAYHRAFPLREEEIRLLFPLIAARLCLSVCISWHQQKQEPENRHLSMSESGAWALLAQLRAIHPRYAHYHFRADCDLAPCPQAAAVSAWLGAQSRPPSWAMP